MDEEQLYETSMKIEPSKGVTQQLNPIYGQMQQTPRFFQSTDRLDLSSVQKFVGEGKQIRKAMNPVYGNPKVKEMLKANSTPRMTTETPTDPHIHMLKSKRSLSRIKFRSKRITNLS